MSGLGERLPWHSPHDPLARRTYRHPGNVFAGTVGTGVFLLSALSDHDRTMVVVFGVVALAFAWAGWTCRMTITRHGVIVQNCLRSRTYPWREITAVHMVRARGADVLQLEMPGRRQVRVWAAAVGGIAGGEAHSRRVKARLDEAREAARETGTQG